MIYPSRGGGEASSLSTSSHGSTGEADNSTNLTAQPSALASSQSSQLNQSSSSTEKLCITDVSVISSPSLPPSLHQSQPSQTAPTTSTPCRASPVAQYTIRKARFGSQELEPPPNRKYPVLKVLPMAQQLIVECSIDGERTAFVIRKENTNQVFFCRFKGGRGHLLGWDPLPTSVGSFECYRTMHLVFSQGTLVEERFATKMSMFFKGSFKVVC